MEGSLVLPDYKNTRSSVDIADYGYSAKNGNIVDAGGTEYNTLATVHTHPGGGGPSTYIRGQGYGDLGFAAFCTPNKPVYVLEMDSQKQISLVVASPNTTGKIADFNYVLHTLSKVEVSTDNLIQGTFKLSTYTKGINFIKELEK